MGTSKSYGGPTDPRRLLPRLPLPADGGGASIAAPAEGQRAAGAPGVLSSPAPTTPAEAVVAPPPSFPSPPAQVAQPWRAARRTLGATVRSSGGARDYRSAGRDYVRAKGGAQRAASAASAGRGATARFAGFISSLPSIGVAAAAQRLGLGSLAGQSVDAILAAVTDALAPPGATLEEAAARRAIAETLAELYEKWGVEEGGLERLQSMAPADVRAAVVESVAAYIFVRWTLELGLAVERKAVSVHEAVAMEGEMRQYIRDALKLDLSATDVLAVDWNGAEGQRIVARVYQEAYTLIETTQ